MQIKMSRVEGGGDCECCGFYIDEYLTVTVDGVIVGDYSTDGHFGYSRINEGEVEADIARAVGAETGYVSFCASRQAEHVRLAEMVEAANTDAEIDAVNKAYEAAGQSFVVWLKTLGHEVEEVFSVEERPVYEDEDDWGV